MDRAEQSATNWSLEMTAHRVSGSLKLTDRLKFGAGNSGPQQVAPSKLGR